MRTRWSLLGALAIILLLALAACGKSNSGAKIESLDAQTAYEQLSANKDAQFIDVRDANEWAATGIPTGAKPISLGQLEERAPAELAKDKPVYLICGSGLRSQSAADKLKRQGYSQLYIITGGVPAWQKAGLPVEPYKP